MKKQIAVIGIEMHCELKSNSKVFSSAKNAYSVIPNTNINPLDMAFPGTLPVVNLKCVRDALKMSMVLNCKQPEYMFFDRKNYYYPDLPKGYQITQSTSPVGTDGSIDIECNNKIITVGIHDIHLEEDTAKLDHLDNMSLLDYNRAGIPLLELVTTPCMHSADEVMAFIEHIRLMYQYCDISDADIRKGQIRCDVNISIMDEDATEFGTKVEVKGVDFSGIRGTIDYEIDRQIKLKSEGRYDEVEQETRRWDEASGTTIRMRSKVDAIDYKYFVEPNIPKFRITQALLEDIRKEIPVFALERKNLYINKYGLDETNARIIIKDRFVADYFEKCIALGIDAKIAANWITGLITSYINKEGISVNDFYLKPEYLKQIIDALNKGEISSKQAKEIFAKACDEKKEPANYISSDNKQISDEKYIEEIIDNILANNEENIIAYQNGKTNMFDFFVGQVMKETKGKANPIITKELIHKKIDK